jgi:ketosteroid isomerase-like protein
MTADDVRSFFAALSQGDVSTLEARLAEDVVLEFPGSRFGGTQEGRRRVVVFLKQNQRLFQGGLAFEVRWAGVCGDRAIAQWTNAGTTREGTTYANRGVTVFTLRAGMGGEQIVRIEDYLDTERLAATWPK